MSNSENDRGEPTPIATLAATDPVSEPAEPTTQPTIDPATGPILILATDPTANSAKPSNLIYKTGDVLKATEEYIVHQCNCITTRGGGLAMMIAQKFPYAAPYVHRRPYPGRFPRCLPEDEAKPGTIQVWRGEEEGQPAFIGLFAQYKGGECDERETTGQREIWFKECLESLEEDVIDLQSLAFPYRIGCGIAGGNWRAYEGMIKSWAEKHPGITVAIYKLEEEEENVEPPTCQGRGRGGGRGRDRDRGSGSGSRSEGGSERGRGRGRARARGRACGRGN